MSNKQVEKHECIVCESTFKIVFELENSSGYPKFCPFCGSPFEEDDEDNDGYWPDGDDA